MECLFWSGKPSGVHVAAVLVNHSMNWHAELPLASPASPFDRPWLSLRTSCHCEWPNFTDKVPADWRGEAADDSECQLESG
eukprot:5025395-Amphidinium_carterae.1